MKIINLFPTAVGHHKLRTLTPQEQQVLMELGADRCSNEGNKTSINRTVLRDPRLKDLRELLVGHLQDYVTGVIAPATNAQIALTQSWLNFNDKDEYHHRHNHPCSWLSACYYVSANPEFDRIYFYKTGYDRLLFESSTYNQWNSLSWWVPVETGDFVIFPSSLEHNVSPNTQDGHTRISLAINTWFNGDAGQESGRTLLSLRLAGPYEDDAN